MAEQVAQIPLDGSPAEPRKGQVRTAAEDGLRPAIAPTSRDGALKVEVMDPHDLWDARDGMRGAFAGAAPRVAEAAAPAVTRAVVRQVSAAVESRTATLRPTLGQDAAPISAHRTIQLGAYSSPAAARSAWSQVSEGGARSALSNLSPIYETVRVNGRALTRLKVSAPASGAAAICRAAQVTDPWCARRA